MVIAPEQLPHMSADELREVVQSLLKTVTFKQATIDKLTHENAYLKRLKFAAQSERFSAEQRSLLEETLDEDLQAVNDEIEQLNSCDAPAPRVKEQPKRQPLPANLPRIEIRHEPDSTTCACGCQMKRIGEDVAEKLDYQPGVFSVERHVRGKWVCAKCETLIQAPVDAHIIDKGIPTAGLLAQVLVAKFADHLPLYRQETIFGRAGLAIARSTLGAWVGSCGVQLQPLVDALKADILLHSVIHAEETPVQMLKPGNGKTHRAYLWAYAAGAFENTRAVVYDFCESRSGENAKVFLGDWRGSLVCDDFSGYVAVKDMLRQPVRRRAIGSSVGQAVCT
jgi:transposase